MPQFDRLARRPHAARSLIELRLHSPKLPLYLFDNHFISHVWNHAGIRLIYQLIFLRTLCDGQHQLTYVENIQATTGIAAKLGVPEWFALNLEPFMGMGHYVFRVRLRYRIREGKLIFVYKIHRPELAIEHIWNAAREKIQKETGLPVLLGPTPDEVQAFE
jgi:hypothetical protein